MAGMIDVEVKGLVELQRKTIQMAKDLHGAPIVEAMQTSILEVTRDARMVVPVDTGNLRDHILPKIDLTETEVLGIVGTNVEYGPAVEFGSRPHWPPIEPLASWVRRHNIGEEGYEYGIAMLIAYKIAAHGTKARPYLIPSFEKNEANIRRRFDNAVEVIVNK